MRCCCCWGWGPESVRPSIAMGWRDPPRWRLRSGCESCCRSLIPGASPTRAQEDPTPILSFQQMRCWIVIACCSCCASVRGAAVVAAVHAAVRRRILRLSAAVPACARTPPRSCDCDCLTSRSSVVVTQASSSPETPTEVNRRREGRMDEWSTGQQHEHSATRENLPGVHTVQPGSGLCLLCSPSSALS